jgi:hypothetical protein
MRRPIVIVTLSSVLIAVLLSIVPAHAANEVGATTPTAGATFYAFSRMPAGTQSDLKPLPDAELAAIVGAAGGVLGGRLSINVDLDFVVQTNVCAICNDVQQSNFSISGLPAIGLNLGGSGFAGLR